MGVQSYQPISPSSSTRSKNRRTWLASPDDPPDKPNTLPRPELNPLLNPLLADNMGRWAEVYFTAPPEKREEAVLDLLRELEAVNPQHLNPHDPALRAAFQEPVRVPGNFPEQLKEAETVNRTQCPSCGHENPDAHQFCGKCGASIESVTIPTNSAIYESRSDGSDREDIPALSKATSASVEVDAGQEDRLSGRDSRSNEPAGGHDDLSLFRSFSAHRSADDYGLEPSRPYRLYIGAILAILIVGLGYMAWKVSGSSQAHQAPAPPPTTAPENRAAGPSSRTAEAVPTQAESSAHAAAPAAPAKSAPAQDSAKAPDTATHAVEQQAEQSKAPASPAASDSAASTPPSPGAEELATARRYLVGSAGRARDTGEAVRWLWKSIAKHNGEATLLLADLYLKGEGVSQNCDQARVLLDTAARRGVTGAGERLRNLQASGCQ